MRRSLRTFVASVLVATPLTLLNASPASAAQLLDSSNGDFAQGQLNGTTVDGGSVTSALISSDFSSLPSGWTNIVTTSGGTATVNSGKLEADGVRYGSNVRVNSGSVLEFNAKFTGDEYQHIGFGHDYLAGEGALFSSLYPGTFAARVPGISDVSLSTSYLNAYHDYRIEWRGESFVFFIDSTQVADIAATPTQTAVPMRALIVDHWSGSGVLKADSLSVTPLTHPNTNFSSMPADWTNVVATGGGTATISSGKLEADGVRFGSDVRVNSGSVLEFNAKFTGDEYQHIGFGNDYLSAEGAMFSSLYPGTFSARVPGITDVSLSTSYLNAYHDYRIEWRGEGFVFFIDNTQVADIAAPISRVSLPMRALIFDYWSGSGVLKVDSLSVTSLTHPNTSFSSMPSDWSTVVTTSGGTATISSGKLEADGVRFGSDVRVNSGSVLNFRATFTGDEYQHIGFGHDYQAGEGALFSSLYPGTFSARVPGISDVSLSTSYLNAAHDYRIEWHAEKFVFFIDNSQVASIDATIDRTSVPMRALIDDYWSGNGILKVDSLSVTALSKGTYLSRIHDAGSSINWDELFWSASVPTNTSLAVSVRTGNTSTPNGSWTSFQSIASSGDLINLTGRYLQYRVEFSKLTPNAVGASLNDVSIGDATDFTDTTDTDFGLGAVAGDALVTNNVDGEVSLDGLPATPLSGTFTSQVFDAGRSINWDRVSWNATAPLGTSLAVSVRSGDTAAPDGSWSSFSSVASSGDLVSESGRYLQYEVTLTADDVAVVPVLEDVTITG